MSASKKHSDESACMRDAMEGSGYLFGYPLAFQSMLSGLAVIRTQK